MDASGLAEASGSVIVSGSGVVSGLMLTMGSPVVPEVETGSLLWLAAGTSLFPPSSRGSSVA